MNKAEAPDRKSSGAAGHDAPSFPAHEAEIASKVRPLPAMINRNLAQQPRKTLHPGPPEKSLDRNEVLIGRTVGSDDKTK